MGLGPLNGGDTKFVPGVPLRTPSRLSVEMLGMRAPGRMRNEAFDGRSEMRGGAAAAACIKLRGG